MSWLNRTVIGAGLTSFLADVGYELATALLAPFLRVLGLTRGQAGLALGAIEATAEFVSNAAKLLIGWYSDRVGREVAVVRWGDWGQPVLLFPTAGGDAEEVERFHLVDAVGTLLADRRIKVYSADSGGGRALVTQEGSPAHRCRMLNQYQEFIRHEVVPAIRMDCRSDDITVIATGASIGAFHALAVLCRYPDVFAAALLNSQPMGFYAPSQIVRDAQEHGVEVRPVDVNTSDWDCALEDESTPSGELHRRHESMRDDIRTKCALRLGFRQISGFSEEDAKTIESVRGRGFDSVRDLWLRTRLKPATLEKLAQADAFR